jgi:hypothetical protein
LVIDLPLHGHVSALACVPTLPDILIQRDASGYPSFAHRSSQRQQLALVATTRLSIDETGVGMATEGDGALEVVRPNFRVRVDPSGPWFHVDLSSFSQPLHASISIDTLTDSDRVIAQSFDGLSRCSGGERFTWIAKTTLWQKRYHLDIFASHIEFSAEVVGDGDVDTMRFFDAVDDSGFRPHFALTKHFNDKGRTDIREYAKGSPP